MKPPHYDSYLRVCKEVDELFKRWDEYELAGNTAECENCFYQIKKRMIQIQQYKILLHLAKGDTKCEATLF